MFEKWWNSAFESEGLCNQLLGHRNAEVCMNCCVILSDINPKVWWFHWLVPQSVEFGWNFIKHVSIYMNNRDVSDNISLDNRLVFSIKPDLLWIRKCSRNRWHQTLWSNMFQVHQTSKEIKSLVRWAFLSTMSYYWINSISFEYWKSSKLLKRRLWETAARIMR